MIRVGIAGAGYIGSRHAVAYELIPGVSVASVCDERAEPAARLAERCGARACGSLDGMFAQGIDMLDICLPTYLHYPAAAAALRRGIPVLCEKPMALEGKDALSMLTLSRENRAPLMIGHTLRFDARYGALKQCIAGNRFGKLISARLYRHSPVPSWSAGRWIVDGKLSGGVAFDLHIHDADIACWLLGRPEWIFARGDECQMVSIFGYDGLCVSAEASWRPQAGFAFESGFDAVFERATLRFDGESLHIADDRETRRLAPFGLGIDADIYRYDDPIANEIAYFVRCMQGNLPLDNCTPESSRVSLGIVEAERESMATGLLIKTA